jgi:hypothetical protein
MDKYGAFLEQLAKTDTGSTLISYLKAVEIHYADIRNLNGVPADVRIDALKIFRETLLDKLLLLSGEIDPPDGDEYH